MSTTSQRPSHILPVIIISQFAGTSLWFAGNAILPELVAEYNISNDIIAEISSAIQLGFILGTLIYAILLLSDRFSPTLVFLISAALASLSNSIVLIIEPTFLVILVSRILTGFFLAGIYPVGMKVAAGWYKGGLGKALGYLVGALVLGTAFPHLLTAGDTLLDWRTVIFFVSILATAGGLLLFLAVPTGPYNASAGRFHPKALFQLFRNNNFRAAASGYFGHMWELYTFWAFVPVMLAAHQSSGYSQQVSLFAFIVIASGGISCAIGGIIALQKGSARVAFLSLLTSGLCCISFPAALHLPYPLYLLFLCIWGFCVISDSPQFSSLVAKNSDPKLVGSGLTIVNSIGFAITILSISIFELSWMEFGEWSTFILLPGPLFGLLSMRRLLR